jgi:ABC-2 type transport system permease protein
MLDYTSFSVISWIFWGIYLRVITGGGRPRGKQMTGTSEVTFACPVKRPVILTGFCLSNFIVGLPSLIAVFVSAFLMGARLSTTSINALLNFVAVILGVGGCFGFGFILAGLTVKYGEPSIIDAVLLHPLMYFSSILYAVAVLPVAARWIAYLTPTAHAVGSMRGLLSGTRTTFPLEIELSVITAFAVLLPLTGLLIYNKLRKSYEKEGLGGC